MNILTRSLPRSTVQCTYDIAYDGNGNYPWTSGSLKGHTGCPAPYGRLCRRRRRHQSPFREKQPHGMEIPMKTEALHDKGAVTVLYAYATTTRP